MDIQEFVAFHRPALEGDVARHTVLLAILARALEEDPPGQTQIWSLGDAGACAARSPGHGVVFGDVTRGQCRELAETLAGTHFHGVLGNDDTALWFVERAWQHGATFKDPMPQRLNAITAPPIYPGADGNARPLTSDDADLFAEWFPLFCKEASPEDEIPPREHLDRGAASGRFMLWEVDGKPVSMAGIVRRVKNCAAIAAVYTPPELRGRGYAGSVTAAVVEKVYAEGRRAACLYTDLRNPASNRCYEKIGFKPLCDSWFFLQKSEK
ncbi:MAG TPA: GNAT family N-acetyltransferase [Hyphomicrobiales bacterium]|nr:GNAT family N-acetyltransferase [Hyphomicrobiales bacterium]